MKFRLHGATLGLEPGGGTFPLVALCVIRGTPLNFRSRRTSRPTEADAGTGEFAPNPTFNLQFRVGIRANCGFDRPWFANHSQSGSGSISKWIAARPCHAPSSGDRMALPLTSASPRQSESSVETTLGAKGSRKLSPAGLKARVGRRHEKISGALSF